MKIDKFNNNLGFDKGLVLMEKFFDSCSNTAKESYDARRFAIGLKSLLDDNTKDTVFHDDVLVRAEGISPRMFFFS